MAGEGNELHRTAASRFAVGRVLGSDRVAGPTRLVTSCRQGPSVGAGSRRPFRRGADDANQRTADASAAAPAGVTLWSFLYASRSLIDPSRAQAEIAQLVAHAADRNRACAITGALVFSFGHFAQVLEGPYPELHGLIADIAADTRHTDFVTLRYLPINTRRFAGWSLAYNGRSAYVQRSILLPFEQARRGATPEVEHLMQLIEEFARRM